MQIALNNCNFSHVDIFAKFAYKRCMSIIPVILSGGSGTRLWPLSNNDKPKQFLPLVTNNSMIQETYLRLNGLDVSSPIVCCNTSHRFLVAQQLEEISVKNPRILLEPVAKNTAPAIAAACCCAVKEDPEAVVIVLPSDHSIANIDAFKNALNLAIQEADKGSLVTFGIVPTFPATGYGYVKGSKDSSSIDGSVQYLEKFVEKPDSETAKKFLESGEYSWNSGIFVFKAKTFLEELSSFEPDICSLATASFEKAEVDQDFIRLERGCFELITGNSIDYAVMEKTKKGKIVRLDAGWSDVGSWSALWEMKEKDSSGNVIKGKVIALESKNSYIRADKRMIATIGVEDLVIVETSDAILVAAKDKVQNVKQIAEMANKRFV